jgi:TP901 family phage tail tape measure protein
VADRTSTHKIISQVSAQDQGAVRLYQQLTRELEKLTLQQTNLRAAAQNVAQGLGPQNVAITDITSKAAGLDQRIGLLNAQIGATPAHVKQLAAGMGTAAQATGGFTKNAQAAHTAHGGLMRQMAGSGPPIQNFARGILSASANIPLMTGGLVAAGIVLANFVQTSLGNFAQLEQAVADIAAIKPEIDTDALFGQLSELQTRIPATSKELAASYYAIAQSIDLSAEQTLALTEKITRGAIAANADTAQWSQIVVGSMHQLGLGVQDVDHLMDVLITTINRGDVTGQELAAGWGRLVTAGTAVGASLEEIGGALVAVSKSAAPAAEDINNLTNAYQKLATDEAAGRLAAMGVEIADQAGNIRPLVDILTDLKIRLDDVARSQGEAGRAQALQNIFPDQQARAGINELLKRIPLIRSATEESIGAANVAWDAMATRIDTAAAKMKLVEGNIRHAQEAVGGFLAGVASALVQSGKDFRANTDAFGEDFIPWLNKGGRDLEEFWAWLNGTSEEFKRWRIEAETAEKGGGDFFENVASSISRTTTTYLTSTQQATAAFDEQARAAELSFGITQRATNSLGISLGTFQTQVAAMATANNQEYNEFKRTATEALAKIVADIKVLETEQRNLTVNTGKDMGEAGDAYERMAIRAGAALAAARNAQKELEQGLTDLESEPARIGRDVRTEQESLEYEKKLDEARKAAGIITETAIEKEARLAAERRKAAIDAFNQLQATTAATKRVQEAQDALTASTEKYRTELARLKQAKEDSLKAEEFEVAALGAAALRSELERLRDTAEEFGNSIKEATRTARIELTNTEAAAERFLETYREGVRAAEAAQNNLRDAANEVRDTFDRQAYELDLAMRKIEAQERRVISQLDAQIQAYQNALDALSRRHEQNLRPIQDAIYDQQQAVDRLDDAVREVAASYDRDLIPRQKELNALNKEAAEIDAARRFHDQRLEIQNLSAALQILTPGTAEYVEAQRRLSEAQQDLSVGERRFDLEQEIAGIEEAKEQAVDAAQARADAARAELETLREREEVLQRQYDLERRLIEENMAAVEAQRKARQDEFDTTKEGLRAQQQQLSQTRTDFEMAYKAFEKAAEQAVESARLTLSSMEAIAQSYIQPIKDRITFLETMERNSQTYYENEMKRVGNEITEVERQETAIRARHKGERDEIDTTITSTQALAEEEEKAAKREVEARQSVIDKLKEQWAWQNAINQLIQAGAPVPTGTKPYTPPPAPKTPPPTPGPGPHGFPITSPPPDGFAPNRLPEMPFNPAAYAPAFAPVGGGGGQAQQVILNMPINALIQPKGPVTSRDRAEIKRVMSQAVVDQMYTSGYLR